jgi:hypothetical protein
METADKKSAKELLDRLEPVWLTQLNSSQQVAVIGMANAMLKKRMTAFPNFNNYILVILSSNDGKKSVQQFLDWHDIASKTIAKITTGKFDQFLQTSQDLFLNNALYQSNAISWYATRGDFTFSFDSIPKVHFETGDIRGLTRGDSTLIKLTSGVLHLLDYKFYGTKGKILWTRNNLSEDEANATLTHYVIPVKSTKFSADTATLYFPKYFKEPLLGQVTEKLSDNVEGRDATYPRFTNYNNSFAIKNIYKNVDYIGGITIQGKQLIGSGTSQDRATFTFNREGKPFLITRSKSFLIEDNSLQSSSASVKFFIEEDSVVHPGVSFRFLDEKKELYLLRKQEGISKTPFFDSYHQLDMDFELLTWKTDEPTMRFKAIAGAVESKALFESADYFREQRFIEIQGIDNESPLLVLRKLADKLGRDEFSFKEAVNWYRVDETQVKHILLRLSYLGFIIYDEEAEWVSLKPRLRKYLLAINGRADYDVIQFFSNVYGSDNNAELSENL